MAGGAVYDRCNGILCFCLSQLRNVYHPKTGELSNAPLPGCFETHQEARRRMPQLLPIVG